MALNYTKVCILSDSHDNWPLLNRAVEEAKGMGAEAVLHCGDVVSPNTLRILERQGLPIHVIHGNNHGDLPMLSRLAGRKGSLIHYYGQDASLEVAGKRVFLVHYPHYARALALTGDWDVVCCGHDHRLAIETVANVGGGETWLVNPGTVAGLGAPATWVLGDLRRLEFRPYTLEK